MPWQSNQDDDSDKGSSDKGGGPWGGGPSGDSGGGSGSGKSGSGKSGNGKSGGGKSGGNGPSNNGSGNNGSGGNTPGGGGFGNIFNIGQDFLKHSGLPGGNSGKSLWGIAIVALLALWLVSSTFYQVNTGEVAVVQQFGRYVRTEQPGLHTKLPNPIETKTIQATSRVNQLTIGSGSGETQNLVLTGDQNLVAVAYTVRWRIKTPRDFQFRLASPQDTIIEVAESVTRQVMARSTMNAAMGPERTQIAAMIGARMQEVLDNYGAGVEVEVFLNQVDPPEKVVEAFRQVTAAQQDAKTSVNQANAYKRQRLAQAQGEAARFNAAYEQYRQAPGPTRTRLYMETMEQIFAGTSKVIVDSKGVMPYLPLPQMQAAAKPAAPKE